MGLSTVFLRPVGPALYALALLSLALTCLAVPLSAEAQIWVITEPDGTERFTTEPEPGARIFLRTRYTASSRSSPAVSVPYGESIRAAAADNGLEAALVTAVIAAESNFDPHALSAKGAQGLMQLMPATADDLGVRDVWDPDQNIRGGTAHLARLLGKYDDVSLALAAYNAGEGTVDSHGGVPPFQETQQYVQRVLDYYRAYRGSNDQQ